MVLNLLSLADDVLLDTMELLDFRAVLSCQATCRRMNCVITSSISLQYMIELAACGMVDGPRGGQSLDITERLRRLRLYDTAWRHLRWTKAEKVTHLNGLSAPSLDDNTLIFRHELSTGHSSYMIPSTLCGVDEKHFDPVSYGASRVVVTDASQDLLVSREPSSRYHLQALSTGGPHPLAWHDDFICTPQDARSLHIFDICGDFLLALVVLLSGVRYVVWNWKTGATEYRASEPANTRYNIRCFFDPEHILVECNGRTEPSDFPSHVGLHIFRFRAGPSASEHPESVSSRPSYCFAFPEIMQRRQISIDTTASSWRTAKSLAPRNFSSNANDRVFSVDMTLYADGKMHQRHYYIPSTTFYSYMKSHPMTGTPASIHVPWDAWGRMGSMATLPMGRNTADIRRPDAVGGMRSLFIDHADSGTSNAVILDFHPLRVARAAMLQRDGDTDITIHRGVTLQDMPAGYEDTETMLPCIVTKISLPAEFTSGGSRWRRSKTYLCDNGVVFMVLDGPSQKVASAWLYTI
ncbi:hypothetical protein BV25DRAFT_1916877 [Artomyces pyxidatus]|uniref:Uncharacterized protein n=1 Tax=Artomyces pyxidatus TaxID=48021 RepID=A0ACB8SZA0_9AGAM|nr:hypothetical protein BV25DRAFT_1916877 [Artomyces pyxidatus]